MFLVIQGSVSQRLRFTVSWTYIVLDGRPIPVNGESKQWQEQPAIAKSNLKLILVIVKHSPEAHLKESCYYPNRSHLASPLINRKFPVLYHIDVLLIDVSVSGQLPPGQSQCEQSITLNICTKQ